MSAPLFEHGPVRPITAWVLSGLTLAGWVAILVENPPGASPMSTAFVMVVAAIPLGFAALMFWFGRHRVCVDTEGVWRDDELLVPAEEVVAIGVHVQLTSSFPLTRSGGERWGQPRVEFSLHEQGSVYVPLPDRSARGHLPMAMSEIVVADGRRGVRGRRPGRVVLVPRREARAFVDALLAVAPQVDAPTQILEPERVPSLMYTGTKTGPGHVPPLEDWSWEQGTELAG